TVRWSMIVKVPSTPLGERLTCPSCLPGEVATKKTFCRSMNSASRPSIASKIFAMLPSRPSSADESASPDRQNGSPMVTRPPAGTIPDAPGSYQFKDRDGRVIYVGKAKSLRSRLSNYFVNPALLPSRTRQMVTAAESVEWIEVRNEVEALFLEFNLIKKHKPRFNIRLKDDKSYPYLAVTVSEEWPRAMVMR